MISTPYSPPPGLEAHLGAIVTAIARNKSVRSLHLARNLNSIKSKHVPQVTTKIFQMEIFQKISNVQFSQYFKYNFFKRFQIKSFKLYMLVFILFCCVTVLLPKKPLIAYMRACLILVLQ